jgi:hypothetical protein
MSASASFGALDPKRLMLVVDREIKRVGMMATLRREGAADRPCWMYFGQWSPAELMGRLIEPLDRVAVVSAVGLTDPPTHTKDRLITFVQPVGANRVEDENLRILSPPIRIDPAGIVIAWRLRVRR